MKVKLPFVLIFCSHLLFSCTPSKLERVGVFDLLKNFYKDLDPVEKKADLLNGVWANKWTNRDGYVIDEFIIIDKTHRDSFLCVLNTMGGFEYSPITFSADKIFTTFIDPNKDVYINNLSIYGKNNIGVELNYAIGSDTLKWAYPLQNVSRSYAYTRISPSDKKLWELFNSTCGKILTQKANINTKTLKIEKLEYTDASSIVSVLQTSHQIDENTNYCVFNANGNTVLSLPIKTFANNDIAFSNLDVMDTYDRAKYFKPISLFKIEKQVSPEMLALCSAFIANTRADAILSNFDPFNLEMQSYQKELQRELQKSEPPMHNPFNMDVPIAENKYTGAFNTSLTSTYLVCNYRNLENGSNASWEWGEYPRWEWQSQRASCGGFSRENCLNLNGYWARDDEGLTAMGTMFVMDTSSHIEADFSRACNAKNKLTNQGPNREFAQYYVADSILSFNHTIWFQKTRDDTSYTLPFDRMVAFGDSLSDNGNLHNATAGVAVIGGYYQGRFSNGPVWVEYLSKKLNVDLYDWAVSAAVSDINDPSDFFKGMSYTVQAELFDYIRAISDIGITEEEISKTLFTVLFGGNNFVRNVRDTPEEVAEDIDRLVNMLIQLGAKHVMIVNLPDLSLAPKFYGDFEKESEIKWKVMDLNRFMFENYKKLKIYNPNVKFYYVDLYAITDDAVKNPSKFFITNTTDQCYMGKVFAAYDPLNICASPMTYIFWDNLHPATSLHCQVAEYAMNSIFDQFSMPNIEPDYKGCVSSFIH